MDNIEILKKEFNYYIENKQKFIEKYNNKYIALKEHKVICEANSRKEAISIALTNGHSLGTFLVQFVTKDKSEIMQEYYSRVYC